MSLILSNKTIKNLKKKSMNLIDIYGLELGLYRRDLKIKTLGSFYNKSKIKKNKSWSLNKRTKKELYERAKTKNISGRSAMNKIELINALKSA
jgi:hypothetical protein